MVGTNLLTISNTCNLVEHINPVFNTKIYGEKLESVEVEKLLGIQIVQSLHYYSHIDYVCKSLRYKSTTVRCIELGNSFH